MDQRIQSNRGRNAAAIRLRDIDPTENVPVTIWLSGPKLPEPDEFVGRGEDDRGDVPDERVVAGHLVNAVLIALAENALIGAQFVAKVASNRLSESELNGVADDVVCAAGNGGRYIGRIGRQRDGEGWNATRADRKADPGSLPEAR